MKLAVLVLLVLLVPSGLSHFSDGTPLGVDVTTTQTTIFAASAFYSSVGWNNQEREVATVNAVNLTTEAPIHRDLLIIVHITLTFVHNSNGVGQFVILDDGEFSQTCSGQTNTVNIVTVTEPAHPEGRHHTIRCLYEDSQLNETHPFTLFMSTASGSPASMQRVNIGVEVQQIDYYQVENMDVSITEFAFWMPLLFWLGLLIWALWQDWIWTAAFTIPGLLQTLFPSQIPGEFSEYFLLAVVGLIMEYFAWQRRTKSEASGL